MNLELTVNQKPKNVLCLLPLGVVVAHRTLTATAWVRIPQGLFRCSNSNLNKLDNKRFL